MKTQSLKQAPHAVVVGMDSITGLQSARILAGHGIPVIGIAGDPKHYCCRTRACERLLTADTTNSELIDALTTLGKHFEEKAVLVPCTDISVLLISQHRSSLQAWYHIKLPELKVVDMLVDKISFHQYALGADLPIPKTYILRCQDEARAAAVKLSYPCILKPSIKSALWLDNVSAKVFKIGNADELLDIYDYCSAWADALMVQEWIPGPDNEHYTCNCYFNDKSEPLVTFISRKLRQWPPGTGTGSLSEEARDDTVLQETLNLFKGVNYQGLGYVELKRDRRTGNYFIIEPNIGRPTGRSAIAEAGGVELLYTMYCDALGLPLPENRKQLYRGVKWIYWRHDLQSAIYYWRQGQLTLKEWWHSWRGCKGYAVLSWRDPLPFLADALRVIGLIVRNERKDRKGSLQELAGRSLAP